MIFVGIVVGFVLVGAAILGLMIYIAKKEKV